MYKAHNFESFEQDFNDLKHYSRFFVHLISSCFLLKIRSANYLLQTTKVELYKKQKKEIGPLNVINGGWHCSWCFTPQGIRQIMEAYEDFPDLEYPFYVYIVNMNETKDVMQGNCIIGNA